MKRCCPITHTDTHTHTHTHIYICVCVRVCVCVYNFNNISTLIKTFVNIYKFKSDYRLRN